MAVFRPGFLLSPFPALPPLPFRISEAVLLPPEWEPPEAGAPFPLPAAEALEDWIFREADSTDFVCKSLALD